MIKDITFTNITFPNLVDYNINLLEEIPIDIARGLAKSAMKAKLPFTEDKHTAKIFTADMSFYTCLNGSDWHLVLIKGDIAKVYPIPGKPLTEVWHCFRLEKSGNWAWWSFGYEFPLMLNSLISIYNCIDFDIFNDVLFGTTIDDSVFAIKISESIDDIESLYNSLNKESKKLKKKIYLEVDVPNPF